MLPANLPPIKNKFVYVLKIIAKLISFFVIGFSSVILGILVFPVMRIIFHPKKRFQKHGRRFISAALQFFVFLMHSMRIVDRVQSDKKFYKNLTSKIIVANHPSLLDVIMLLSLIPNADCIVNAYLRRNVLTGVVLQLYIVADEDLDVVLNSCIDSLNEGNCLIIFPEGTRTPRNGRNILKKGAARIALASSCGIVPVHIGGTDKYGLGKKDPLFSFNPNERYVYEMTMKDEIDPNVYKDLPAPAAAKAITSKIEKALFNT